jgi:hypothetical protein
MSLKDLDKRHMPKKEEEHKKPIMADDILSKMRMGKRTFSEIRMGDQIIPVRILSADEVNAIRHEAKIKIAKTGGDETDENLYIQKVTLQLASQMINDPVPFLNDKIMKHLSVDEIGYLYNELIHFWETLNPSLEQIEPERFRELVEALKKNSISWNDCSLAERRVIFLSFVEWIQRPDIQTSQQVN